MQTLVDFVSTVILNVWNVIKQAGVYFLIFVAVTFVYPILRKWVIAMRGGK